MIKSVVSVPFTLDACIWGIFFSLGDRIREGVVMFRYVVAHIEYKQLE